MSNAANAVTALSDLGTSWTAIASTATVNAIDNTFTSGGGGVPIYLLNDTKFVDDYADLWDGTVDFPLSINETAAAFNNFVWTGTDESGVGIPGEELGSVDPSLGGSLDSTAKWIEVGLVSTASSSFSFYGISGVLVAVPEPSAFLCVGLVGLGFAGWKRRTANRDPS